MIHSITHAATFALRFARGHIVPGPNRRAASLFKIVILAFTSILSLTIASCSLFDGSDSALGDRIVSELNKSPRTPVRIVSITPFDWDELFLFMPYTPAQFMDRELGFHWPDAKRVDLMYDEGAVVFAFVANRQVVRYIKLRRGRADFGIPGPGVSHRFSPETAVFILRIVNGWKYVDVVPVSMTDVSAR